MNSREQISSIMHPPPTRGVLSDAEVLLVDLVEGKRVLRSLLLPLDARELSGLLEYAWQTELAELWVMPGTSRSRNATCDWFEQVNKQWVAVVHPAPREPTRPSCVLLWPKESERREGRRLVIVFPEHAGWGWTLSDATSLLATVTYLDQVLARPIFDAPDLVAHQLLSELIFDSPGAEARSSAADLRDLRSLVGGPLAALERAAAPAWIRPLTLGEQRQKYLHKYTHLSRALEACMRVRLGVGAPHFSSSGRAYDGICPGIWRVSIEQAGSVFDGKRLPSCRDGEWMSTPQVTCCRDIGYHVQVHEGYFWPQSDTLLKRWATALWQAAERLHTRPQSYRHAQARANAARAIMLLAESGVAILGREQTDGGWSRPDWKVQIAGACQAALFAHLVRLVRKGTMPLLVKQEALWVVSDDPHPLTAVPGLVTARPWQGYSVGYEVPLPLSREVKDILSTAEHADQAVLALDTLAGKGFP